MTETTLPAFGGTSRDIGVSGVSDRGRSVALKADPPWMVARAFGTAAQKRVSPAYAECQGIGSTMHRAEPADRRAHRNNNCSAFSSQLWFYRSVSLLRIFAYRRGPQIGAGRTLTPSVGRCSRVPAVLSNRRSVLASMPSRSRCARLSFMAFSCSGAYPCQSVTSPTIRIGSRVRHDFVGLPGNFLSVRLDRLRTDRWARRGRSCRALPLSPARRPRWPRPAWR